MIVYSQHDHMLWQRVRDWYLAHGFTRAAADMREIRRMRDPEELLRELERFSKTRL